MNINIPELSLVVLIGASGSGKSTFAHRHFKSTEILSSDYCRALVSDDENDQAATNDAFDVLHFIAAKRLAAGKLVVVDATNVQVEARKPLVALAKQYHCLPVAIVLNMPERLCQDRNRERPDRDFGPHVVRNHTRLLRQSLRGLEREGFRHVFILDSPDEVENALVSRVPLHNNKKDEHGPFDIIGDIHGCYDELIELLTKLGYVFSPLPSEERASSGEGLGVRAPADRKAVFVGDLVDRGPNTPAVLRLVMSMVEAGAALCVPGNHDMKLLRKLRGRDVQIAHGLGETLKQLEGESPEFIKQVEKFLDSLISHYVLDDGKVVVAHAGMKEEMQGRGSGAVRNFALFGETSGETDEFGLPIRYNWAENYRGKAAVVYGHTPVPSAEWLNNTIDIDTGCVFGGSLTALRWPERELVSVKSHGTYAEPMRPFLTVPETGLTHQQHVDDVLDIDDVVGKRLISTRLHGNVTIREENAIAALEVMSRFAADPKWLIYLPPTMSPTETSQEPGLLEHPAEAFGYYRAAGVTEVVCEEKHMGSRAVVIVCRDADAARRRFGITSVDSSPSRFGRGAEERGVVGSSSHLPSEERALSPQGITPVRGAPGEGPGVRALGICYTRTGRRFFDDDALEAEFLTVVRDAITESGLWDELSTDWICLDCELMPWSAKAQELLRQQYAAVGAAATGALAPAIDLLDKVAERVPEAAELRDKYQARQANAELFVDAYRRYCWPVTSIADLKLAPFHILATEGAVHIDKDHIWHMQTLAQMCTSGLLMRTPYKVFDVTDDTAVAEGIAWWEELTARGGEGMVVKPLNFVAENNGRLVQPAVKCRGREYLRIIYGPDYTAPENLDRLRSRSLGAKRSLALREFALGIEALERFTRREPLRRVHECVFGVLALESEPVDPRL